MTTAATLMFDTPSPAATPAAAMAGASGQSPFAAVLAEGGILQVSDLEQLVSANMPFAADGVFGAAMPADHAADHAADHGADSGPGIFALLNTTALASPSAAIAIPDLDRGAGNQGAGVSPPAAGAADGLLLAAQGVPTAPQGLPAPQGAPTAQSVVPAIGTAPAAAPAAAPAGGHQALSPAAAAIPGTVPAASTPPAVERAPTTLAGTAPSARPPFETATAPDIDRPAGAGQTPTAATATPVALHPAAARGDTATPTPAVQAAPVAVAASAAAPRGEARPAAAPDARLVAQTAAPLHQLSRASIDKGAATKPALRQPVALAGDVAVAAMPGAAADEAKQPAPTNPMPANPTPANPRPAIAAKGGGPEQPLNGVPDATPAKAGTAAAPAFAEAIEQAAAPRAPVEARLDTANLAPQQAARASVAPSETAALQGRPAAPPQPPAEQVALQLRNAVAKGIDQIRIQLRPATLGAVDITLDVSANARVAVQVVAERADTLELLRSDARGLERALQEAGLRTDSGSLNFSLRGEGQQKNDHEFSPAQGDGDSADADGTADGADHDGPTPQQASSRALDINV